MASRRALISGTTSVFAELSEVGDALEVTAGGLVSSNSSNLALSAGGSFVVVDATKTFDATSIDRQSAAGITIGGTNANAVSIGRTGVTTTIVGKLAAEGGVDFTGDVTIAEASGNTAVFDMTDGESAAVSATDHGRLRFNETLNYFEVSENGGAYAQAFGGGGGSGGWTDDGGNVRLTTFTDTVSIGVASMSGAEKLRVAGSALFEVWDDDSLAFLIEEGSNVYYNIDTSDGTEVISYGHSSTSLQHQFQGQQLQVGIPLNGTQLDFDVPVNLNALRIEEGGNLLYAQLSTIASQEGWTFGNTSNNPNFTLAGTGVVSVYGKLNAHAGVDVTGELTIAESSGNTAILDMTDGESAAVSASGHGRIRFNETTSKFEVSESGVAWTTMVVGGGSAGGWTDDGGVVRLTTAGDDVAIGAAAMVDTEKLYVEGDLRAAGSYFMSSGAVSRYVSVFPATGSSIGTRLWVAAGDGGPTAGSGAGLYLYGGNGGASGGYGGDVEITAGYGQTAAGGAVEINGGRGFTGDGGNVKIDGGRGDTQDGLISIGVEYGREVWIGQIDCPTKVIGSLSMTHSSSVNQAFFDMERGQSAPVSDLGHGRLRYNSTLNQWEYSEHGGGWLAAFAGASSPWTLSAGIIRPTTVTDVVAVGTASMYGSEDFRVEGESSFGDDILFTNYNVLTTPKGVALDGYGLTITTGLGADGSYGGNARNGGIILIETGPGGDVREDHVGEGGDGGDLYLLGGAGGGGDGAAERDGNGGIVTIEGGSGGLWGTNDTKRGHGGVVNITGGRGGFGGKGDGDGGNVLVTAGKAGYCTSGSLISSPGQLIMKGGPGNISGYAVSHSNGGAAWLTGGEIGLSSSNMNGGDANVLGGKNDAVGSGVHGSVNLGTQTTAAINIGYTGIPTNISGELFIDDGGSGLAAFFDMAGGDSAAVSQALHGRLRYNESANRFEYSENGGAYAAAFGGGGGGGGWVDDGTIVRLETATDDVAIGVAVMSGAEKLRVLGGARFDVPDASAGVFVVEEGADGVYFSIDTSTGSEAVKLGNATTSAVITQLGTGQVTFGGNVDANAGLDVTGSVTIAESSGNTAVLDMTDGESAAVSGTDHGRLRFNETLNYFEVSENGGAYAQAFGAGGGGGWQDDGTVIRPTTLTDDVAIGVATMSGTEKLRVVGDVVAEGELQLEAAALLRLAERVSAPSAVSDKGFLYSKDIGGITELFYHDYDSGGSHEVQITTNGAVNASSVAGGGWSQTVNIVHLTTSSNTVAVGANSMLGSEKLLVVGDIVIDDGGDLRWDYHSGERRIFPDAAPAETVGEALSSHGGAGGAAGVGAGQSGGYNHHSGGVGGAGTALLAAGSGGSTLVGGGAAGAANGGAGAAGGNATFRGGAGSGSGVGGNVGLTGGASAGVGASGGVTIDAGAPGAAAVGAINIGTVNAVDVNIGQPAHGVGVNICILDDTSSFVVKEGTNEYINIDTSNGLEAITLGYQGGTIWTVVTPILSLQDNVNNTAALEMSHGQSADLSTADNGRIRYNVTLNQFEYSEDGSAYAAAFGVSSGWVDDGTVVRLDTATDNVAIGVAAMSGAEKLRVLGGSRFDGTVTIAESSGNTAALDMTDGDSAAQSVTDHGRLRFNKALHYFEVSENGGVYAQAFGGGGGGGGWVDDGTVVRLETATDDVAIGAATMVGTEKLRVVGDTRLEGNVLFSGNANIGCAQIASAGDDGYAMGVVSGQGGDNPTGDGGGGGEAQFAGARGGVAGGALNNGGDGGPAYVKGGPGGAATGTGNGGHGGEAFLIGGTGTASSGGGSTGWGGSAYVAGGPGSTNGRVHIGKTNTLAVEVGTPTVNTYVKGPLLVESTSATASLDMTDGDSAAAAPANHGNLRYNESTQEFETSQNTGAYNPLNAPGVKQVASQATTTTTSTTPVLVNSMTDTPEAGTYLVTFQGSLQHSSNGSWIWPSIYAGGVQILASRRVFKRGNAQGDVATPFSTTAIVTVNGAQAIEGRWSTSVATATCYERSLTIMRIRTDAF